MPTPVSAVCCPSQLALAYLVRVAESSPAAGPAVGGLLRHLCLHCGERADPRGQAREAKERDTPLPLHLISHFSLRAALPRVRACYANCAGVFCVREGTAEHLSDDAGTTLATVSAQAVAAATRLLSALPPRETFGLVRFLARLSRNPKARQNPETTPFPLIPRRCFALFAIAPLPHGGLLLPRNAQSLPACIVF